MLSALNYFCWASHKGNVDGDIVFLGDEEK